MFTLPAPAPVDEWLVPVWERPQLQLRTSISSLWVLSTDSPLMSSIFRKISTAMTASPCVLRPLRPCLSEPCYPSCPLPRFRRRQLRRQAQRDSQPFQLVVRPEEELRGVVPRVAFHLLDDHLGGSQRLARLHLFARVLGISIDVLDDPALKPVLHVIALFEGSDLVANDALQVVSEPTRREEIREARREVRVRRRIRVVVYGWLLHRLCSYERCEVGILLVNQRHEAVFCELGFPAVGDRDFRGAFHVHATVVGREGVGRKTVHRAARLDAANARAPAVLLE